MGPANSGVGQQGTDPILAETQSPPDKNQFQKQYHTRGLSTRGWRTCPPSFPRPSTQAVLPSGCRCVLGHCSTSRSLNARIYNRTTNPSIPGRCEDSGGSRRRAGAVVRTRQTLRSVTPAPSPGPRRSKLAGDVLP